MKKQNIKQLIIRIVLILLPTLLLLAGAAVGAAAIVLCGPSDCAQAQLTRYWENSDTMAFVPDLFLTEEQIIGIMSESEEAVPVDKTDVPLSAIEATHPESSKESHADLTAEENDIEFVEITGPTYRGIMMIVKDPSRIFVGTPDRYGGSGLTLEKMVEKYDALGGINGGGFHDPNGNGQGGVPTGIVITEGKLIYGNRATYSNVIGFDADSILHVGKMTAAEALEQNIQWACSFGPALVINGEPATDPLLEATQNLNPRTAIGQRADGAVLLLVIDGRQVTSLGATYDDLIAIMLEHGAVNASNLDGGSSSQMLYDDGTLSLNAAVTGLRPLPTAILVRK